MEKIPLRLDSKTLSNCCKVCKTWFRFISERRQFMLTNSKLVVVDRWTPNKTCSRKLAYSFTMYMDGWTKGATQEDFLLSSRILQNDEVASYINRIKNDVVGYPYFNRLMCDMLLFYDSQTAYLPAQS